MIGRARDDEAGDMSSGSRRRLVLCGWVRIGCVAGHEIGRQE